MFDWVLNTPVTFLPVKANWHQQTFFLFWQRLFPTEVYAKNLEEMLLSTQAIYLEVSYDMQEIIFDALRDVVSCLQFKKTGKTLMEACFCTFFWILQIVSNRTKSLICWKKLVFALSLKRIEKLNFWDSKNFKTRESQVQNHQPRYH